MANLFVVLVIAGCAAYQYLKGTFVKAFATIIIIICAGIVAFGYFETLANVFVSRGGEGRFSAVIPWAQTLSFALLFILTFAILQTAGTFLTSQPVALGVLPERIGRVVCGIFSGLILSGIILTALAMAPLSSKYPYQRFDQSFPDPDRPDKVLLNADGFITGWFSMISNGSFSAISNKKSFATLHPAFLDQLFLNRHSIDDNVSIITPSQAIELPATKEMPACWYAPEDTRDSDGNPLQKADFDLVIVRIGIKTIALEQTGTFTPSQIRLICKSNGLKNRFVGKARNIYPIGYLKAKNQVQKKKLNDKIIIERRSAGEKWIDLAFFVPKGLAPVLVEFKQNNIAEVPPPVRAEQAPSITPFVEPSEKGSDARRRDSSSEQPRPSDQPETPSGKRGLSNFSRSIVGNQLDENQ